jgi:hypothetical protein
LSEKSVAKLGPGRHGFNYLDWYNCGSFNRRRRLLSFFWLLVVKTLKHVRREAADNRKDYKCRRYEAESYRQILVTAGAGQAAAVVG